MRETDLATIGDDDLRARYRAEGYVLLRKFLPASVVETLRDAYLGLYRAAPAAGGVLPSHGVKGHPAFEFVRGATFRRFVEQPVFKAFADRLTGAVAVPIRRTPLRHFPAGSGIASRAHIDGTYINGAPTDIVTIWTPLGACPIDGGSLMYLEGSHADPALADKVRGGAPLDRTSDVRPITHDLKWLADVTASRWLAADFAAGDVVVHSPSIIHATLDAATHTRVSADIRFRRVDGPQDPRWENDWSADDGY